MKKLTLPLVAVIVAMLPAAAFAATLGINTNATTSTNVTAGSTSTSASTNTSANANVGINGSLSDKSNFSDVIGTLSSPSTSASIDFTTLHAKHIKFVLVSKLSGYAASGLKISRANMKNMAALDAKIAADATLTAALRKHGYSASNVIAVASDAKGDLTVFIAK